MPNGERRDVHAADGERPPPLARTAALHAHVWARLPAHRTLAFRVRSSVAELPSPRGDFYNYLQNSSHSLPFAGIHTCLICSRKEREVD
eukprot:6174950-Pleurochrysis_carterae.AAC.1